MRRSCVFQARSGIRLACQTGLRRFRDRCCRPSAHRARGARAPGDGGAARKTRAMAVPADGRIQGSPQPSRCVRAEFEVAVERKLDRIVGADHWWFLQPHTVFDAAPMLSTAYQPSGRCRSSGPPARSSSGRAASPPRVRRRGRGDWHDSLAGPPAPRKRSARRMMSAGQQRNR